MANADRPSGLSPVKHLTGAPYNGQANLYVILAADTNAYAIGDPVTLSSSGGNDLGYPAVTLATAGSGNAILGAIVGIGSGVAEGAMFNPSDLDNTTRPDAAQSDDWYVLVADSPDLIFEVQEADGGTAFTKSNVGGLANLASGDNNGFQSGWELSQTAVAADAEGQVQLLGLARTADNDFGDHAKWLVKINAHALAGGQTA